MRTKEQICKNFSPVLQRKNDYSKTLTRLLPKQITAHYNKKTNIQETNANNRSTVGESPSRTHACSSTIFISGFPPDSTPLSSQQYSDILKKSHQYQIWTPSPRWWTDSRLSSIKRPHSHHPPHCNIYTKFFFAGIPRALDIRPTTTTFFVQNIVMQGVPWYTIKVILYMKPMTWRIVRHDMRFQQAWLRCVQEAFDPTKLIVVEIIIPVPSTSWVIFSPTCRPLFANVG